MVDSSCCLMGKQLDPGTEVPAVFCKSHTNGPDEQHVSAGTAMPSPAAVPKAWLRKNCSFPHTQWGPAYPPCPHSLSQQTFLSGWQCHLLWKVLASSSYEEVLERQLKNSDTDEVFSSQFPSFLTPEKRLNRCQDDSSISLPCFI